jgi:transglutaminase-like putative cysteine protease
MGWIEFDPTNNLIPEERHIVTAFGRDYADVSPLKGIVIGSGQHKVKVEVDVIPL